MEMDRHKILQDALEMARHNYYCYSRWEGKFDDEEQEEKEKIKILEAMIAELPDSDFRHLTVFSGHIISLAHEVDLQKEYICSRILLAVKSGFKCGVCDTRAFFIQYPFYEEWFISREENLGRYYRENGIDIRVWVDRLNYINKIEWVKEDDMNDDNELKTPKSDL